MELFYKAQGKKLAKEKKATFTRAYSAIRLFLLLELRSLKT